MFSKLRVSQSKNLSGSIEISGAKNSVLPILAASLLSREQLVIENVPNISDVRVMLEILEEIGSRSEFDTENNRVTVFAKKNIKSSIENLILSEKIRASSLFLGPLLAVCGEAQIPKPGGCRIGPRLMDMHLHFLKKMGAEVIETDEFIQLKANKKIVGVQVDFYKMSVGATQNIMMAAVLAEGQTIINGASIEPETADLGNFLIAMGAKISGLGTSRVVIDGVENNLILNKPYRIIYDRLEAGSFAVLALATKSIFFLRNCPSENLSYVIGILQEMGAKLKTETDGLVVDGRDVKLFSRSIVTAPYPYFPTDLQQIFTVLVCVNSGFSIIEERIFDGRFVFIKELIKMGAKIHQANSGKIIVEGVDKLYGCEVEGSDLRGTMALLIAGLTAEGETTINNAHYLERGYERLLEKLERVGCKFCVSSLENQLLSFSEDCISMKNDRI